MGLRGLFFFVANIAIAGTLAVTGPAGAQSASQKVACGTTYTVQDGDTLYTIAERAYGEGWRFDVLQKASERKHLKLDVGDELIVPCLEQDEDSDVSAALAAPTGSVAPEAPLGDETAGDALDGLALAPEPLVIRIAVLDDAGDSSGQRTGPVLADLLSEALTAVRPDHRIVFIEDAGRPHPAIGAGWHAALPWSARGCTGNCPGGERLALSEPVYSIPLRILMRAGDPRAATPEALNGRRLCMPADQHLSSVSAKDLAVPGARLIQATTAGQCFAMLRDRRLDAVVLAGPALTATREASAPDIVEATALATGLTFHIAIDMSREGAGDLMNLVDSGLRLVKESGRWFEVVLAHHARSAAFN